MALVRLSLEGTTVRIAATSLGDRFSDYVAATEGSRYDRKTRTSTVPLDRVEPIVQRLREARIDHEACKLLREAFQRMNKAQWNDLRGVRDRIDRIDEEMAARSGERLYPFQRFGCQWLATRRGGCLFDDQGLGKTRQGLAAIPANVPVVVVGPTIVKGVWAGEIARFRPHLRSAILKGRNSFRWPAPGEAVLLNFEILPKAHADGCDGKLPAEPCEGCTTEMRLVPGRGFVERPAHLKTCTGEGKRPYCPGCAPFLNACPDGCVFIVDEGHYVKEPSAARTQSARAIAAACRRVGGRSWVFTGTPGTDPREIWCVLSVAGVAEEAFGSYGKMIETFKGTKVTFGKSGRTGYVWGDAEDIDQDDVVGRLRRVTLRRLKADVLTELPARTWRDLEVEIDDKTIRLCDKLLGAGLDLDKLVGRIDAGREELKFEGLAAVRAALATAKIPALVSVVEEAEAEGEPLVVFSAHRAPIEHLAKRKGWAAILGGMKEDKGEIVERFQAGKLRGVACTIGAGAEGVTLTRANRMVFVDLHWNPNKNAQASDRIYRIGQGRNVQQIVLMADHPLDRRVSEVLSKKLRFVSHTVDAAAADEDKAEASVGELDEALKKAQEAAAFGRAVRREAETPEEERALAELRDGAFGSATDERLATKLVREADAVGLSAKQWELAKKLARAVVPPKEEKAG